MSSFKDYIHVVHEEIPDRCGAVVDTDARSRVGYSMIARICERRAVANAVWVCLYETTVLADR